MNCDEVGKYVDVYVDNEFDERDRIELESHLTECNGCRQLVSRERDFRRDLKDTLKPIAAPSHLRAAIAEQLSDADAPVTRRPDRTLRFLTRYVPLAAAAALALFLLWPPATNTVPTTALTTSAMATGGTNEIPPGIQQGVQTAVVRVGQPMSSGVVPAVPRTTLAHYSLLKADVHGGEPDIRRYMQARVPFKIQAPLTEGKGVRLAGAREVAEDGRPAVLFIYSVDGERVNIVQSAATVADGAAPSLKLQRRSTLTWGQFTRNGIRHTIASEMEPIRISRLLDTHLRR